MMKLSLLSLILVGLLVSSSAANFLSKGTGKDTYIEITGSELLIQRYNDNLTNDQFTDIIKQGVKIWESNSGLNTLTLVFESNQISDVSEGIALLKELKNL